jgi:hypothetical protein
MRVSKREGLQSRFCTSSKYQQIIFSGNRQVCRLMALPTGSRTNSTSESTITIQQEISISLSIAVPCQRVIASSGELTGYVGGTDRKQWLLDGCSPTQLLAMSYQVHQI